MVFVVFCITVTYSVFVPQVTGISKSPLTSTVLVKLLNAVPFQIFASTVAAGTAVALPRPTTCVALIFVIAGPTDSEPT